MNTLHVIIPGDIDTHTGGYAYDRRILAGLRDGGLDVRLNTLAGSYPFPSEADREDAAVCFASIPDGALTLVDGLAGGVLPTLFEQHRERLRLVALVHHPLALETGLSGEASARLRDSESRALRHVRHVITTSASTADALDDYGVPRERITAVPPGTDTAPLATGSDNGHGDGTLRLLCVATLTRRKGHAILLEALSRLAHLPWTLHCVGSVDRDEATTRSLEAQRDALGLVERVRFLGDIDTAGLDAEYLAADVFVLASWHEGFGMVLTEAIARGLPIVTTDAGAIAQTVPPGAGLLVPPGDAERLADALQAVMTQPDTREALRSAAREARRTLYRWDEAASDFLAALERARATPADPQPATDTDIVGRSIP